MKLLRKFIKAGLLTLASILGLLVLFFIFANFSFSQRFITGKANQVLTRSGLPIHIREIHMILPVRVHVRGVRIMGPDGDTLVYAGDIRAGYKPTGFLKRKVVLGDVFMDSVNVKISRDPDSPDYDIALAFGSGEDSGINPAADSKVSWEISVKEGEISETTFMMTDALAGTRIFQRVKALRIKGFLLSLSGNSVIFDTAEIDGAHGGFSVGLHPPLPEAGPVDQPWKVGFKEISLRDLHYTYDDQVDSLFLDVEAWEGLIIANQIEMAKKLIDLRKIFLAQPSATILAVQGSSSSGKVGNATKEPFQWDLLAGAIDLESGTIKLGNYNDTGSVNGNANSEINGLDLSLSKIRLSQAVSYALIEKMNFEAGNGFSLKTMTGGFESNPDSSKMELSIETGNSTMHMHGAAMENFFEIMKDPASVRLAYLNIEQSNLSLWDISYFKTDLNGDEAFRTMAKVPVRVNGGFNLQGSRITIPSFSLHQPGNFEITLSGTVDDLFSPRNPVVDLQIGIPSIGRAWLNELLAGFGMEQQALEYNSLALEGSLSDLLNSPGLNVKINSDLGNIRLSGSLNPRGESYALKSSFDRLMLGEILDNQDLGLLTGSGEITGSGFSLDQISARLNMRVDSLAYKGYEYTGATIKGSVEPGGLELQIHLDDPALMGDINAVVTPGDTLFAVAATTNIFARLNELHLYEDTLSVKGNITANFKKRVGAIEAEVLVSELELKTPADDSRVDLIDAIFTSDSARTSFTGESDFFSAEVMIDKPIGELGTLVEGYRDYVLSFIDPLKEDSAVRVSYLPEMEINGSVAFHDALKIFLPDTSMGFTNLDFSLVHRSSDHRVRYQINGTNLEYDMLKIGNLDARIIDSAGVMNLQVEGLDNQIFGNPTKKILLNSRFSNWKALADLSLLNTRNEIVYGIEVAAAVDSNQIVLQVPSRQLILNREKWLMDTPDLLTVDFADRTFTPDLRMHTDSAQLHLLARTDDEMRRFSLELTNVAIASLLLENSIPGNPMGSISGALNYQLNEGSGKYFSTDLKINNTSWYDLKFNEIGANGSLQSDSPGNYSMDFSAHLDSSSLIMKGEVRDSTTRNFRTAFTAFPLNTVQPLVRDYLSELKGTVSGNFNVISDERKEAYSGGLHIHNAGVRVNTLNSRFKIPSDSLVFRDKRLIFNNFRILDSVNSQLLVDGFVDFTDSKAISTDLGISSSKLQVMNRGKDDNASLYGNAIIDSRLSIKGPLGSPVIRGSVHLAGGSDLFYRHTEDLSLSESERIVRFVDHSQLGTPRPVESKTGSRSLNESSIETRVEIDPSTRIHFNLSKRIYNIDMMIRGGGTLNYQMLKSNQVSLAGMYQISEGTADLKMVGWPAKSFRLTEGGYIRWNGMVEDPELKIEAQSRVRSSYTNPVDGKQRDVDFNVILQLSNRLSDLDVLFTISTSDQYLMSIINTLSPEEQMRQAITILLFENIDLPGISTSTNYMTEQVNQLVASQLNQLTKTTIKNIDISFGLDSYVAATAGGGEETKTSLSYEVRKGLLNERAQIELSGRLNDLSNQPGASDLSINNISFEYRLDSAATKFLKVYNEHAYEDVFEGEVISTGVGITYRKRYRLFREIWQRDPDKKKTRKQQK